MNYSFVFLANVLLTLILLWILELDLGQNLRSPLLIVFQLEYLRIERNHDKLSVCDVELSLVVVFQTTGTDFIVIDRKGHSCTYCKVLSLGCARVHIKQRVSFLLSWGSKHIVILPVEALLWHIDNCQVVKWSRAECFDFWDFSVNNLTNILLEINKFLSNAERHSLSESYLKSSHVFVALWVVDAYHCLNFFSRTISVLLSLYCERARSALFTAWCSNCLVVRLHLTLRIHLWQRLECKDLLEIMEFWNSRRSCPSRHIGRQELCY